MEGRPKRPHSTAGDDGSLAGASVDARLLTQGSHTSLPESKRQRSMFSDETPPSNATTEDLTPEATSTLEMELANSYSENDLGSPNPAYPTPDTCPTCSRSISPHQRIFERTHPESLALPHSDWETFKTKISISLQENFDTSYAVVQVLLLSWSATDLGPMVARETRDLQDVFRDDYGFQTEYFELQGRLARKDLEKKLFDYKHELEVKFLERKTLLIVYYNGHGAVDPSGRLIWSAYASIFFQYALSLCPTLRQFELTRS